MADETSVVSIARQKQNFKKKDRHGIKKRIKELRLQSLKLKKKNLDQKAEKKEIAHQIKELTSQLNNDGVQSLNEEDE